VHESEQSDVCLHGNAKFMTLAVAAALSFSLIMVMIEYNCAPVFFLLFCNFHLLTIT
jgi:hypothetical protein